MGDGAANPLFSVHLVEVGGNLAVSLTYSPVFHDRCVTAPLRRWARTAAVGRRTHDHSSDDYDASPYLQGVDDNAA